MKTIITLDRANKPYGYPQLDSQGRLNATGSLFGTASFATSASYTVTSSYSITSSYSLIASQSNSSITASYYAETDPIFVAKSASLATTGSNAFYGTQTVESGSLNISSGSFNINAQSVFSLATIFTDNYDRSTLSPGGTPSLTYLSGSTSTSGSASIVSNYLNLGNNGTSGSTYATYAIPTINNTLNLNTSSIEWNLNVRTDRTTVFSGFGVGQYGGAIILAGSESDVSSSAGVGYALTYGGEASPNWRSWRLVRYSSSFSNVTTVVSPNTHSFSSPSNYVSVKVVYDPITNIWSLYSRDDGSVAWSTIPLNNSNFIGSAVNTTYTSTPLPYGGFLFNHGAAAGQDLQFDNLFIQTQTSSSVTLLTVSPSLGLIYNSGQFTIDQYNIATISGSLTVTNGISGSLFGIANNSISSSWAPMRPAGLDTQIQYNSGSTLTGIGSFTFNYISQSLQQGSSVTASGLYSHAEGSNTITSGAYSHAEGYQTQAIGNYSHAEGTTFTRAIGDSSHAEGYTTTASGSFSHSEGVDTESIGESSHAEGSNTKSIGNYSHAEGELSQAIGVASHTEGTSTQAIGDYSHTEGEGTQTIGIASHAEGYYTTASGNYSHAEGGATQAIGEYSHAEGDSTQAIGVGSHAEGLYTTASGDWSHVEGYYTISSGSFQHVQGQFNIPSLVQSAFIIGNGAGIGSRKNLIFAAGNTVEITGSLNVSGSITITSGSITMPNRPAFRVTGSGGGKSATTVLSGSYLGVDYQQGSGWNTSTGTFTAPISGLYQVNLVCRTNSNSLGTISQIIVYKNNTTISPSPDGTPQIMVEWHSNTTMNHAGGSTISYLAAGDTLKMIVTVGEISFDQNDNFSVAYIG